MAQCALKAAIASKATATAAAALPTKHDDAAPAPVFSTLDRTSVGYLVLVWCVMVVGSSNDYSLAENSNFIPTALSFTGSQWGDLVGGITYYIRAAVIILLVGFIFDNIPNMRWTSYMLTLSAVASIGFPLTTSFGEWMAFRILYTVTGGASFYILCCNIAYSIPDQFHGLAAAVVGAGAAGSDLLAIVLERVFTTQWRGSFYVDVSLMLGLALLCFFLPEARTSKHKSDTFKEIANTYRVFFRVCVNSFAPAMMFVGLAVQGFVYSSTTLTQQWLVHDLGKNPDDVASIMIVMPFVQLLGTLTIGVVGDLLKPHGVKYWVTGASFGTVGIIACIVMTHCSSTNAGFWIFLVLQQLCVFAPGSMMVVGLLEILPESLYATGTALGYGAFTLFFGMGGKIAQDQAVGWTLDHATIAGHPGAYAYGFLLLHYVGLVQIPAVAIGVWALKRDKEKVARLCAEAGPLLEHKNDPLALEAEGGVPAGGLCCGGCV